MKQFISHQSALEYWRRHRILPGSSAERRCKIVLPDRRVEIEPLLFSEFSIPIHVMIGDRIARHESKKVKQHIFGGKTPVGCFMSVEDKMVVSSPEFCFLQMAEQITMVKLIELGYELCSGYSIPNPDDAEVPDIGFYKRRPLTSVNKLSVFLENMSGFRGYKKVIRALRYILEGSASPMETKLAMFLTLPYMLGGFGFKMPELNRHIVLTKSARKNFNKDYYSCDMFWPDEKIAVEYDSDQQHTGSDRIANDSKRRNALNSLGIRVITITKQQLYSSLEMERAAKVIARHMKKRLFPSKNSFATANRELRKQLLYTPGV